MATWTRRWIASLVAALSFAAVIVGAAAPANAFNGSACATQCASRVGHHPSRLSMSGMNWRAYPYARQTNSRAIDPWGETERQCVSYAAWALNAMGLNFGYRAQGRNGKQVVFGDARTWARATRQGGWRVSHKPAVGAVAQWRAFEMSSWNHGHRTMTAGEYGHVGIVTKVFNDGTVRINQYNATGNRSYSVHREKAPRYLYIGMASH
jgi:surface antigen